MHRLELRIPPLAVFVIFGALAVGVPALVPGLRFHIPGSVPLAVALAIAGTVVAVLGVVEFRRARTTVNPMQPEGASRLVTRGVYGFSRNPMYLGVAMLVLALGTWRSHALSLALVPAFVAYMNRFQIVPEERVLRAKFGEEFSDYTRSVRRWI